MKRRNQSFSVAFCGVIAALAIVCMQIASLVPVLGIIMPGVSGILVLFVCVECGFRLAVAIYFAISLLGLLFVPDKEILFVFISLLGYYPLLKVKIDRVRFFVWRNLCKFLLLNIAIACNILVFYILFPVATLTQEASQLGLIVSMICLVMCQFTFYIYDKALVAVLRLYRNIWRKRFLKRYHM